MRSVTRPSAHSRGPRGSNLDHTTDAAVNPIVNAASVPMLWAGPKECPVVAVMSAIATM